MKLSDFGLCKPLDSLTLSALHENKAMDDESLAEPMDIDDNRSSWKSPSEQLYHWQMNRRKLVCYFPSKFVLIPPKLHLNHLYKNKYNMLQYLFLARAV